EGGGQRRALAVGRALAVVLAVVLAGSIARVARGAARQRGVVPALPRGRQVVPARAVVGARLSRGQPALGGLPRRLAGGALVAGQRQHAGALPLHQLDVVAVVEAQDVEV